MTLATVLAAITWPASTGHLTGIGTTDPLYAQIRASITRLYNGSPTAAAILEAAAAASNLNFMSISNGSEAGVLASGVRYIAIDTTEIANLHYFNSRGRLVQEKFDITLIHEVIHTTGPGDPLPPGTAFTNGHINTPSFDFDGPTVRQQNVVATEMGWGRGDRNNLQKNYYSAMETTDAVFSRFDMGISYSQKREVHTAIIPEREGVGNDDLNLTNSYTVNSIDIIFGLAGDDTLNGGGGSDYLYGGDDADRFVASQGDDLFHGGGTRTSAGAALTLNNDGIDTADYSAATAAEVIKITTDVRVNTHHSNAIDKDHRMLVQQSGTGNGTDTIISVEKVVGTAGVDTFEVTKMDTDQLAGSDGRGGLAEVDLAGQDKPSVEGDLIDATKMEEKLVIDLNPAAGFIQVEGNAEKRVTVLNAERAWGGEKNDRITGNAEANELKGGDGNDILVGAAGDDKIYGGDDKDEIDGEAGDDELHGDKGDDTLRGGADADKLYGGEGKDTLIGGAGLDTFEGGAGNDTLDGATGDDNQAERLEGGAGRDIYYGGQGDTIVDVDQPDAVFVVPAGGAVTPAALPGGQGFASAAATAGAPKRLTGGEREKPPEDPCAPQPADEEEDEDGTYESSDGVVYQYDKGSGNLTATVDGVSITITGYTNGEAGIRLRETRPNQEQAECQRDPLIIDLNGDREVVEELYDSQAYFDLDNDGFAEHVAWALPEDGLLALDGNGDGLITSGAELFGTGRTVSRGSRTAQEGTDGFAELAKLDSNKDGIIDSADARFGELRVWQDSNGDAVTDEGELKTLAELGLVSISLAKTESDDIDCGCDGTDIVSMSRVVRSDGSVTRAYDAFLSIDQYDSYELNPVEVSAAAEALPQLIGSGTLSDLRVAMSRDPVLLEMVEAFAALRPGDAGAIFAGVENILLRWTGADSVVVDSRGPNINARWVAAIEAITGSSFQQAAVGANPRQDAASILAGEWQEWVAETAAKLLGQTEIGAALMPGLRYAAGAFFVKEDDATLDDVLAAIAAGAPAGLSDAAGYWHVMLNALGRYAGEFGKTVEQIDALADAILSARGFPFDAGDLRDAIVGGAASGSLRGQFTWTGRGGDDLLVASAGVDKANGGSGNDRYVLGGSPGNVEIDDESGTDEIYIDLPSTAVSLLFEPNDAGARVSLVSAAGVHASFDFEVRYGSYDSTIERIRFSDGVVRNLTDGVSLAAADGSRIVFGSHMEGLELAGGPGNDLLIGFSHAETYRVGPDGGNDSIREMGGAESTGDRVLVDAPRSDVEFEVRSGTGGADVVMRFLSTGAEVLIQNLRFGDRAIERFEFSDGSSLTLAELDRILNTGTDAPETILGSSRDDVIDGGGGDDLLRGDSGRDTYVVGPNRGFDRIQDSDIGNVVQIAEGVARDELRFERGGERGFDLVVRIAGSDGGVVIENGLRQPYVTEIRLGDGTVVPFLEILTGLRTPPAGTITGTDRPDELYGTDADERLDGLGGSDRLDGGQGSDTYVFSSGRDVIYDNGFSIDTLLAPAGAKLSDLRFGRSDSQVVVTFRGYEGTVELANRYDSGWGYGDNLFASTDGGSAEYGDVEILQFGDGAAVLLSVDSTIGTAGSDLLFDFSFGRKTYLPGTGDDVILSGGGDSTIVLESGFGDLVVSDLNGQLDVIEFWSGIDAASLSFERDGFDLIVRVAGETGSIRIENQLLPNGVYYQNHSIEMFRFADSSELWGGTVVEGLSTPTDGDDWIAVGVRDGGAGNDVLTGGDEGDSYVFAAGYGHDVIKEFGFDQPEEYTWNRQDDVVTLVGLTQEDVDFALDPDDPHSILLTIRATGETLRIDRTPYDGAPPPEGENRRYMIERFDFADGTSLSGAVVRQRLTDAAATSGDDELVGLGIDIVVDGGGDDRISIDGGGAVVLAAGGGQDIVWFAGPSDPLDILVRGADPEDLIITPLDLVAGIPGQHVRFELPDGSSVTVLHARRTGGGGQPTLMAIEDGGQGSIGLIRFEDGSQVHYSGQLGGLVAGRTTGTPNNDGLLGAHGDVDDLFDPGAGDDVIAGSGGQDRILFGRGSGQDVALDDVVPSWKSTPGTYSVQMLPGIGRDDLEIRLSDDGSQIVIGFDDSPDTIRVGREALSSIEFDDGSVIAFRSLDGSFYGYPGDVIEGGAGNDEIRSSFGGVVVRFGPGGGSDVLSDDTFDYLIGGDATGWGWTGNRLELTGVDGPEDVILARHGESLDLVVILRDSGERITIANQFAGSGRTDDPTRLEAVVTEIAFGETVLSWAEALALVADSDPAEIPVEPNPLLTLFDLETLLGTPTEGDDRLYLDDGRTVAGGEGDDLIVAIGTGTIEWGLGDGDDVLVLGPSAEGGNRVRLPDHDDIADLQLLRGGDGLRDLILVDRESGQRLVVRDQFAGPASPDSDGGESPTPVTIFELADGTELGWSDLFRLIEGTDDSGGGDVTGDPGGAILDGGGGADRLLGGPGDDVYVFDRAFDEDRIRDEGGQDVVRFGEGVRLSDIFFSRTSDGGLLIEVTGRDRLALLIEGQFATESRKIETFLFASGDRLDWDQVEQVILRNGATTGADTITGFASSDRIAGSEGNDVLRGDGGDDLLDGGSGRDMAVFAGRRDQYEVSTLSDGSIEVRDLVAGRDGTDRLTNVEDLRFLGDPADDRDEPLTPVNRAPTVATLSVATAEEQVVSVSLSTLLAQASDADGDALRIAGVLGAEGGEAWIGTDGQLRFKPAADFAGTAIVRYQVVDPNGGVAIGRVEVTVTNVNDAPLAALVSADGLEVVEDAAPGLVATVDATDRDGDLLTFAIVSGNDDGLFGIDGTGAIRTLRAATDADAGSRQLTVAVSDGKGGEVRLTVPMTIVGLNDSPAPADVTIAAAEGGALLAGALDALDPDAAGPAQFDLIEPVDGLTLDWDGTWLFDPGDPAFQALAEGEIRVIEAPFEVADDLGATGTGRFTITVTGVNDAPSASFEPEGMAELKEDDPAAAVGTVLAFDPEGDTVTFAIVGGNAAGLFEIDGSGAVRSIRPAGDPDVGDHRLVVRVSDNHGLFTDVEIPVRVAGVNDVPVAQPAAGAATEDGAVVTGRLAVQDPDLGDIHVFALSTPVAGLTLQPDGQWRFDPSDTAYQGLKAGEQRTLAANYQVSDSAGATGQSTLTIVVTGTNDRPLATLDPGSALHIAEDAPPAVVATLSTLDPDGDSLGLSIVGGNAAGLFEIDGAGTLRSIRPAGDPDVGDHRLVVRVSDNHGLFTDVEVPVRVAGVNDVPVAQPAAGAATEDGAAVTGRLAVQDPDAGDTHVFALSAPVAGLALQPDGQWRFDPSNPAYQGLKAGEQRTLVANYQVSDSAGATGQSALTIVVTGANDQPVATLDPGSALRIAEDAAPAVVATVTTLDPDGDALSFAIGSGNARGLFAVDSSGRVTTVRAAGDSDVGTYQLRIDVADGKGGTASVAVPVTVTNVNDAPTVAAPQADQQWRAGTAATYVIAPGTFADADGDRLTLSATLANGSPLPGWLRFDPASGTFSGTAPREAAGNVQVRVQANDGQASASDDFVIAVQAASGGGSTGGFRFHALDSWYNPAWGGGYNVTFRYTVQADAIVDGKLKLWDIVANYDGPGVVRGGWVTGFGGPTRQIVDSGGDGITFTTVGTGYQPELKVGQSFFLTVRVDGAAYKAEDFDHIIFDRDPPPAQAPAPRPSGAGRLLAMPQLLDDPLGWADLSPGKSGKGADLHSAFGPDRPADPGLFLPDRGDGAMHIDPAGFAIL